jgi:hypothetical protein
MHCFTEQRAAAQCCNVACGKPMAHYFCKVCNLWDDDQTKKIYHCQDCGLCRIGEGLGMRRHGDESANRKCSMTAVRMKFVLHVTHLTMFERMLMSAPAAPWFCLNIY